MMAREGARVLATDVNEAALAALAAEGIETRRLDVLDPAEHRRRRSRPPGRLDVLFNCAGYVAPGTILDCDDEQWDALGRPQHDGDVPDVPRGPARA